MTDSNPVSTVVDDTNSTNKIEQEETTPTDGKKDFSIIFLFF